MPKPASSNSTPSGQFEGMKHLGEKSDALKRAVSILNQQERLVDCLKLCRQGQSGGGQCDGRSSNERMRILNEEIGVLNKERPTVLSMLLDGLKRLGREPAWAVRPETPSRAA